MYRIYVLDGQGSYTDLDIKDMAKGLKTYNPQNLEEGFEKWLTGQSGPDIVEWKENFWLNRKYIASVSKLDSNKPISIPNEEYEENYIIANFPSVDYELK